MIGIGLPLGLSVVDGVYGIIRWKLVIVYNIYWCMLRKLKLQVKDMTSNPNFFSYAQKKLEPLQKLFKTEDGLRWNLRLSKEGHSKKGGVYHAEAQVKTARKNYGADASGETPYAAIDGLKDELSKKITSHKNKRSTKARQGAAWVKKMLRKS